MITGSFYNRDKEEIQVKINTDTDIVLGETSGYYLSGKDPVTIELDNDDTFNSIAQTTCSINLMSESYIPELYSPKDREIGVTVQKVVEKEVETVVDETLSNENSNLETEKIEGLTVIKSTPWLVSYELTGTEHEIDGNHGFEIVCSSTSEIVELRVWDSTSSKYINRIEVAKADTSSGEVRDIYIKLSAYINGVKVPFIAGDVVTLKYGLPLSGSTAPRIFYISDLGSHSGLSTDATYTQNTKDFYTYSYTLTDTYQDLYLSKKGAAIAYYEISVNRSSIPYEIEDTTVYTYKLVTEEDTTYTLPSQITLSGTSKVVEFYTKSSPSIYQHGLNITYSGISVDNCIKITNSDGLNKGDKITITGFTNTTDTTKTSKVHVFYIYHNTPTMLAISDNLPVISSDNELVSLTLTITSDVEDGVIYLALTGTNYDYGCVITSIYLTHDPSYSTTLFTGYVEPLTYNLPYAYHFTELEINCQDYLSTLENHIYKEDDIDLYGYSYVLSLASNVEINDVLETIGLTLTDDDKARFENFKISEILLLGAEEDDVLDCEEILEDICTYFNVHVMSANDSLDPTLVRFFDYDEKINDTSVPFVDYVSGKDTDFSFDEVYSKLVLTVDVQDEETIINSPFDDDSLTSPFTNKQHYNDTFMSWGEGGDSQGAFKNIIKENNSDYDSWSKKSYFLQVYKSNLWSFNTDDYVDSLNGKNQWKVPQYLHDNRFKCAMFSVGSIDNHIEGKDDSAVTNIDMSNYLYISVNGTADQSYTYYPWYGTSALWGTGYYPYNQPNTSPSKSDIDSFISGGGWLAKYNGNDNGGIIGSTDNAAINYIVFSGKIIMKPKYHIMPSLSGQAWLGSDPTIYDKLYKMMANGQKFKGSSGTNGFYTVRFLENETPTSSDKIREPGTDLTKANMQFYNSDFTFENDDGYDDDVWGLTKYKGNSDTGNNDTIPKVPVLLCEMTVGDYFLMETELGVYKWYKDNGDGTYKVWNGSSWGTTSSKPYNFLSTSSSGNYDYQHVFSLGFNPAVGDKVFTKEYDLANNISYTMNLDDAEGTAVALPTGLSGKISFKILAPVSTTWTGEVCTRQPSTWHHSSWDNRTCEILPFTESIIVKEFKCELYSDDAGTNNYAEQDLIYMTGDTLTRGTVGVKDDIDFAFSTALTSEQALEKGQSPGAKLSNVIYNDLPFTGYDSSTGDKPEIRYLTDKYNEYCKPRIKLKTTLKGAPNFFRNYSMNEPKGVFMPMNYEYDVLENKTQYNLKETW